MTEWIGPCYCSWCDGRPDAVHGEEAVELYRLQTKVAGLLIKSRKAEPPAG